MIGGKPGGWAKVEMIRVPAWRGAREDTELYFAKLWAQIGRPGVRRLRGFGEVGEGVCEVMLWAARSGLTIQKTAKFGKNGDIAIEFRADIRYS